ncbi:hypothetical protein EYD45_09775 [Hyunsoonleella flava]|uniref:Uncharacterized protein n=1 Tax=Hyunsoonleella flava TaxID=2527939 RepID=A0A4V2JA65_9FLAO|nr:hypothetical protein [Hyunsoonleella flava]TBN03288.1 hypothetical protein EYD45_09775 [Hyunsoonleella flava]
MFDEPINKFCAMFGHNFKHVSNIDDETTELVCKCCNNHFISTDGGNIMNLSVASDTQSFANYFKTKRTSRLHQFLGFKLK